MLVALKTTPNPLAKHQEKVYVVDDHVGLVFSGLTADARYLCKYMRTETMNYWYSMNSQHPVERLVTKIQTKAQGKTCHGAKRPYGVGMLVGGIDEAGTHLYETCPSANFYEYKAMAIGAKCQSAKTYLERNFDSFDNVSRDELIKHGVKALKASAQEEELTVDNVSVGVLSADEPFHLLDEAELGRFLGGGMQDA